MSTTKNLTRPSVGSLLPAKAPSQVWEDISMDFMDSLLTFHGNTVTVVVIDRFPKSGQFGILATHFYAYNLQQ